MPGAFTPTCTDAHLPGYMNRAAQFAQVGVSNIGVVTTNDRFVNEAWTKALEACTGKPSTLDMYSDGDGDLVKALGLVDDMGFGLGLRSKRFALVVEDGVVAHVATDPGMDEMRETSAEKILRVVTPAPDYSGIESEVDPAVLAVAGALAAAALAYFAQNPPA
jgi:peroxiredoxin